MSTAQSQPSLPPHATGVRLCLDELLYYKNHAHAWLSPKKSLWSQLNGEHQSRRLGRGMDFAEVRQYQSGDDIRSIDWKVTARTGKAHTKLFTEEREQSVIIYIDLSYSMRFGSQLLFKSVQAAHLASLIAWLGVAQKDRVGAVINNGLELIEIKPTARNPGALHLCYELMKANNTALDVQLNDQPSEDTKSIEVILQTIARLSPKGSDLVFLSDFPQLNHQNSSLLNQLRQHNRMQFVHFYDPLELGQTQFRGHEYVSDGKTTRWLNFGQSQVRQQLNQHWFEHQKMIEAICLKTAIPYRTLNAAFPLLTELAKPYGGHHG
ncbi:MAG: DUF58 domain-containing protein [Vibrio sp.]